MIGYGKSKNNIIKGDMAQDDFYMSALISDNKIEEPKTLDEKINKHIDFYFNNKTIDVKSVKCDNYNEIWIELKNDQGLDGWCFSDLDLIAFEQLNYFLIVERTELLKIIDPYQRRFYKKNDKSECIVLNIENVRQIKTNKILWK